MMEDLLDTFLVEKLNPDGKKYDKVSRMEARSEKLDLFILLDVNTEIYPINEKERYAILLTETLHLDGAQAAQAKNSRWWINWEVLEANANCFSGDKRAADSIARVQCCYNITSSRSKADKFEYVMHGKLYKMQKPVVSEANDRMEIYISFGGLQLLLEGSHDWLENFQLDKNYFICMRKLV